jgi:hypothetical protein
LISVESFGVAALVFVTAFGCGNGLLTIAKGTAPAELFGARGLGSLLGHMARAGLYARALSPAFLAGVLSLGLTRNAALASLLGISAAGVGSYVLALRGRSGPSVGTEK